ncbi:MAG TPA: histidine--tRNA ligase [Bacteroidales bacterium]|nr:histidine--tRNA ligase [Bacteroidales bacterium]
MGEKFTIPKGTRDFTPVEMIRRNFIFDTVKKVFSHYGYVPIETPAMENLSTLMGKYGEEGDKLLFKILNSGNYLAGIGPEEINPENPGPLTQKIAEKGLKYDLTVPFARFVVQHQNEITFPFKRYQIQTVWRADKPQKGRYREFFQCDVDVIGSHSLMNEVELVQIIADVFGRLDIRVVIRLNNRKILAGIAEIAGARDRFTDLTIALDKLDKIGLERALGELKEKGFTEAEVEKIMPFTAITGTFEERLRWLEGHLSGSETGLKGIAEMRSVFTRIKFLRLEEICELDITLARGLNYYTGTIFEVKATEVEIGSICGGGRYDDLTGIFGLPGVSGVGISFGADRIYDVLLALNRFPGHDTATTRVLFVNFGEKEELFCLGLASRLREEGISTEIYPDPDKLKKQMKYADQKQIPLVVLAGENEIGSGILTVKNMKTGEQMNLTPGQLVNYCKES